VSVNLGGHCQQLVVVRTSWQEIIRFDFISMVGSSNSMLLFLILPLLQSFMTLQETFQIKEYEMFGACDMHREEEMCI
jgi:hypothetical protein